ncbi:Calcium homeostasis modulator protein 2 Protein FAM26B [Larimichthys crocea]|uniref:Calcium homeostasis modulator protein 2 Protein FAM26B n=1 Tax=Larimichthys crocea TaxID=215358 RepID=A0A6G0HMH4_LARCR|nr:Calcium homeostasis modulator protein 2 Protein FAM26B [Larimichthys crocea]
MAAAALVTENFKFVSLFFKSKDVMIFNGLIALGTVASQTAYSVFAFNCPCSSGKNYRYGLAAIGVPALVFFLVGVMMNNSTWDLVSECRLRQCRKLSGAAAFAVLGNIVGRAVVAPLTWVVISLLQGQAYTCALRSVPKELQGFWAEIERQLKYQSQLIGWLLVAGMSLMVFLLLSAVHARLLAAENIKSFFGFVARREEREEQLAEHQSVSPVCSTNWNRVTGVYLYREKNGLPLYSRLNKWATYNLEHNVEAMDKEMDAIY